MDHSDLKSHLTDERNIVDPVSDNGKDEEENELPSDSKFFLWSEHEASDNGMATSLDYNRPYYIPFSNHYETTFGSEIFECNLSEETKMSQERERQLGAMRKRARHLKDQERKGKTIIKLDMKDKSLEKIVAAIADVCELEVNVGGTTDDDDDKRNVCPAGEFIEKAERAAMIMKRDNNALAAKVDKLEREKLKDCPIPIQVSKGLEVVSSAENLVGVLREINKDINNEKRRNEELKRRLSVIEAPPKLETIKEESRVLWEPSKLATIQEEPSLQSVSKEAPSSTEADSKEVSVVHISCLSPFCILPPIADQKNEQPTGENSVEHDDKVVKRNTTCKFTIGKPAKEQMQNSSVSVGPVKSNAERLRERKINTRLDSKNDSNKTQTNQTSNCSTTHSLNAQTTQKLKKSQIPRWRREPSQYTVTDNVDRALVAEATNAITDEGTNDNGKTLIEAEVNDSGHSFSLRTKPGIQDDGHTKSREFLEEKKSRNIPVYVRKYGNNRRSRAINHQTISQTNESSMMILSSSVLDDTSQ